METPHVFGTLNNLVGIMYSPESVNGTVHPRLAVIMLTPGMLHSAGPFRLHVDLARELGQYEIPSFRFDLSGIGESLAVGSQGDSIQRAIDEVRQAMDLMQRETGIDRFVLFGLCSGADDSLYVTGADERVVGMISLDGLGYRTYQYYAHRLIDNLLPKMLSYRWWLNRIDRLRRRSKQTPATLVGGDDIREFPDRDTAAVMLRRLVDRGTKLLLIYTGGASAYYNYENQFADMFPTLSASAQSSVKWLPNADHAALLCEDRAAIVGMCTNWVREQNFAEPAVCAPEPASCA